MYHVNMDDTLSTHVIFATDARKQLFKGLTVAAEAVSATLGPRGRTVIIQQTGRAPLVTKDGITVARSIKLKHPVERMGAELILEAANQTNEIAGDGTTTATVLTAALVKEGLKLVETGYSPQSVCRGIEDASAQVIAALKQQAKQLTSNDEVSQVGTISANGDAVIGKLIAEAMQAVGKDGIITVEDAKGMATTLTVVDGMQFDRGYISPYFVTDPEHMRAVYDDAFVLVTDKKISNLADVVPLLEQVVRTQQALLIIADDIDGDALSGLVLNRVKANLKVVAIKAPGYGLHRTELLKDICVLTGATLVSSATGMSLTDASLTRLGRVKRFITNAKTTTIVGTGSTKDVVDQHLKELRAQLADVTLAADEITKLKVRVAKLASGVAVIKVGGSTEIEMGERRFRVEDALNATRAATEEGIVPGGGMALFNAVHSVVESNAQSDATVDSEVYAGMQCVFQACLAPLKRIVSNAGQSPTPDVVLHELKRARDLASTEVDGYGYNAATGEYGSLIDMAVIDPVKVTRTALQLAASVAVTFLSLDAVVYDDTTTTTKDDAAHDDSQ